MHIEAELDDIHAERLRPVPSEIPHAPDPILAELWQIKRDIHREAGYDIEKLAQMAHEAAERVRRQWREQAKTLSADSKIAS